MKQSSAFSAIVAIAAATTAHAGVFDTLEFEDLIAGTTYNTGDSFESQGVTILLEEFFWIPNGSTLNGFAEVINPNTPVPATASSPTTPTSTSSSSSRRPSSASPTPMRAGM